MKNDGFKSLRAYQLGFNLAMEIFEISKQFPKEERYSLTDQIRRSSRSVCTNIAEAYRKKNYPAHFISKVSDSDMENSETSVWLDFALACEYISPEMHQNLLSLNSQIGKLLNYMMHNDEKFTRKSTN